MTQSDKGHLSEPWIPIHGYLDGKALVDVNALEQAELALTQAQARCAELEKALSHILWIKDCGIDGTDDTGRFRNWPEAERDAMYDIAKTAINDAASSGQKEVE